MKYSERKAVALDIDRFHRIRWIQSMFTKYETYYRKEIQRMISNQRMYWGVNFGQWPSYAVERLIAQGRKPPTFNIVAKKIESQIGSYLSNGFDMKYETRSGRMSHWSLKLMDMMFSDKSNCDWETSEIVALRDMHCMVGYERMHISDMFDSDFGNIAWEPLPPTHVFIDPAWKTPYSNDVNNYFEYGDYSTEQISNMFPRAAGHLKELRQREEIDGINYGEYMGGVQRYRTSEEKWGDLHRVYTFHYVKNKEREWEYDLVNRNAFPETGYEFGSDEDVAAKKEYMQQAGITENEVTIVRQKRRVKQIEAICPTVDNEFFLASGKDRIQTNNCNIYPIGNSFYGQFRGVVDDLADIQLSFNKGKMMIEDIIQRSAKGAFILDKALTGGDARVQEEIENKWNESAARIWVDEGATAELGNHGGVIELKGAQPTPEMFRVEQENLTFADWLSTMPAAMDSRTEGANESGKLFQSKVQVGLVTQKYGMKIYERHKREKAQAYPLQAKITYSGYPREFRRKGKNDPLVINQQSFDESNRRVFINDITIMPEMTVILVPASSGASLRSELRNQYGETLQYLNDPNDRLLKLVFIKGIFETSDLSEEKREEIDAATNLLLGNMAMQLSIQYKQLDAQYQQMGMAQGGSPDGEDAVSEGEFDHSKAIAGTPQEANPAEQPKPQIASQPQPEGVMNE